MASLSYADLMSQTKTIVDGLRTDLTSLPAGISESSIEELEAVKERVEALNSEQQTLKASLKAKTKELEKSLKALREGFSKMKKRIKVDVEAQHWKKYGIEDKR